MHHRKGPPTHTNPHPSVLICADPANPVSANRMRAQLEKAGMRVTVINDYDQCMLGVAQQGNMAIVNLLVKHQTLVLMGNDKADIAPHTYGEDKHPETQSEAEVAFLAQRADFENLLIKEVRRRKMPMLGICGGMQRFNTAYGGTLHQELSDIVGHSAHAQHQDIPASIPTHAVIVEPGEFARMLKKAPGSRVDLNSRHHQCIKTLGKGLRMTAYAAEAVCSTNTEFRVPEVIESNNMNVHFVLGIQSHPELLADETIIHAVSERLKEAAQSFAKSTDRENAHAPRTHAEHAKRNGDLRLRF